MKIGIILFSLLLISACSTVKNSTDYNNEIIYTFLKIGYKNGHYDVVHQNASTQFLTDLSDLNLGKLCMKIAANLKNKDIPVCNIVKDLIEHNKDQPKLSIVSDKSAGYVIDDIGNSIYKLNSESRFKYPDADCFLSISLPVYDKKSEYFAIYMDRNCHYSGANYLFIFKFIDGEIDLENIEYIPIIGWQA